VRFYRGAEWLTTCEAGSVRKTPEKEDPSRGKEKTKPEEGKSKDFSAENPSFSMA
jgi:hypothetical protein